MKFEQLQERLKPLGLGHKILMGIGPMSKNTVDAIIEMVNVLHIPIQLIASRRQIECEALGGGYVCNWTTEEFAKYVKANDKTNNIILCRDHGGPWQGTDESKLSAAKAMERAFYSYEADIKSGFDVIHIDPSLQDRPLQNIKKDIDRILDHCEGIRGSEDVAYECGTEETNGKTTDVKDFEAFVEHCGKISPKIKFVVGQTGTLVKETRNVGKYDNNKARELVEICNRHGMLLKEHNLDYASEMVLRDHLPAGIHAVNIAPEFGVLETKKLLELLTRHKLKKERKEFIALAVQSRKWEKWLIDDSELDDEEKAVICGHYIFEHPKVLEMKHTLSQYMYLDEVLKAEISTRLLKYLRDFRWIV